MGVFGILMSSFLLLSQEFPTQNSSIVDIKESTNLDLVTRDCCKYFSLVTNHGTLVLQEKSLLLLRLNDLKAGPQGAEDPSWFTVVKNKYYIQHFLHTELAENTDIPIALLVQKCSTRASDWWSHYPPKIQ